MNSWNGVDWSPANTPAFASGSIPPTRVVGTDGGVNANSGTLNFFAGVTVFPNRSVAAPIIRATSVIGTKTADGTNDSLILQAVVNNVEIRAAAAINIGIDAPTDVLLGEVASQIGFFGHAAQARPTGVAVTAAAIHASLVSLGLITA